METFILYYELSNIPKGKNMHPILDSTLIQSDRVIARLVNGPLRDHKLGCCKVLLNINLRERPPMA